jgi:hypothetical protein
MFSQTWFGTAENWKEVLYEKYAPSVVVVVRMNNNEVTGFGSGFNVDKNGLIVTNYHVIEEGDRVEVKFKDGDSYEALHYIFVDKDKDFVILKIAGHDLPYSNFGNSEEVKIGQEVVAIGNPEGAFHSMTSGIISQKIQVGSHQLFQTDVTIAPGSSGGPLFNSNNQIIGITSSGLKVGLDINYAIPSKYVQGAINSHSSNTKKLIGFDRNKRLDEVLAIVKNGSFKIFPNQTMGEAANNALKNPKWSSGIGYTSGQPLVTLTGGLLSGGKPADLLWQFQVNEVEGSFVTNAIEIDGVPQSDDMINDLFDILFKDDSDQAKSTSEKPTNEKPKKAQVPKASSEEIEWYYTLLGCYCWYLLFLGLLPRG